MSVMYISASEYENIMNGKQEYALSSCGLIDKKFLKKCEKDTKKTIERLTKKIERRTNRNDSLCK